jgi:hypothetical protein
MARVETLNPTCPLQHFEFIIPDGMAIISSRAVYEISTEYILKQFIAPINNRPPIFKNIYPLAIEWHSISHDEPRSGTIIPQKWVWETD